MKTEGIRKRNFKAKTFNEEDKSKIEKLVQQGKFLIQTPSQYCQVSKFKN